MAEFENCEIEEPVGEPKPRRSTFLLILCILTFINSGYSFFYYLLLPIFKDILPVAFEQTRALFATDAAMQEQVKQLLYFLLAVESWKYVALAIPFAIAIIGACYMLKMKKLGFHLYIIAQMLIFAGVNFLIGGMMKMNPVDIFWTLIFILLYYSQLKKAKVL